jgi:hypothetical protein
MFASHQDMMIASSKTYWLITTQQTFRQKTLNNLRFCSELTKRRWFWIKKIIFFRFDINEILFIDIVNLNISVDVITFHIVFVQISFLLCLIDMNRLRFYFNNLINMFIEKRSINKVLFRKEFYVIHSNQIKRLQTQILMSSKSLTQNDNTILDFQINLKTFQLTNDLQISLKIEYFCTIDNLHISMKNEHHSMIRRYDHAFFLKHFCAVINNEIFRSKFLLFYRNWIASSSSTFRSFFDSTSANDSWSIRSWSKFLSDRIFYQVLSSLSNSSKICESI